ncbi:hypothetical protein PF005_g23674 [Phytophthora fragariae]|uniref:Uncharacterized protein n=1 Tax=Phytophthora fragariae TaxID=53985 RepID=A0A6A3QNG0_9STRA|nr:hypothetical protein PF003_g30416 [Phytophthora fragariae]KAE9078876.1 hypothetical protein PF007_g23675 [Phytophthora fragariae]KAE9179474.1 hypothetical protein PF005_g23674 [Phytophthora fragariae]KAE9181784.1 hypothetical protein PF004_g24430 [Phytophthora fragariae]KAE9278465.1 hypothetical protein PF001_g25150 [Phytophthora fragariae]
MDAGDAASGGRSTYEETLEKSALYDCNAVKDSRGDDEMRRLPERWRAKNRLRDASLR